VFLLGDITIPKKRKQNETQVLQSKCGNRTTMTKESIHLVGRNTRMGTCAVCFENALVFTLKEIPQGELPICGACIVRNYNFLKICKRCCGVLPKSYKQKYCSQCVKDIAFEKLQKRLTKKIQKLI
jgi:hypothetical protein